jgi:hypothetical protein
MVRKITLLSLILTQSVFAVEAPKSAETAKEACMAYRISDTSSVNPKVSCVVPVGETQSQGFQPVKVFLGGLVTSGAITSYKPAHYWNLEAELAFDIKEGMSFTIENVQIANTKGLKFSVYHASANGYDLVHSFEIPGYLITDLSSQAVAVSAGEKSILHVGKTSTGLEKIIAGQIEVKDGGNSIWDVEGDNNDVTVDMSTGEYEYSENSNGAAGEISKEIYVGDSFVQLHLKDAGRKPVNSFQAKTVAATKAPSNGMIVFGLEFISSSK